MVQSERMVGNCDALPANVRDGLIIVVSDSDIHRAARLHLERHGNEAVAKARDMVRTWLRIIVAIEVLQRESAT
jgi:hypothetical protein